MAQKRGPILTTSLFWSICRIQQNALLITPHHNKTHQNTKPKRTGRDQTLIARVSRVGGAGGTFHLPAVPPDHVLHMFFFSLSFSTGACPKRFHAAGGLRRLNFGVRVHFSVGVCSEDSESIANRPVKPIVRCSLRLRRSVFLVTILRFVTDCSCFLQENFMNFFLFCFLYNREC